MLGNLLDTRSLQIARGALDGLSRRQEVIANNVANIDTPGFQRRAVDFESALREEMQGSNGVRLAATDERHFSPAMHGSSASDSVVPRDVISERNDANTVNIDEEMTLLAETQLRYQALTQTVGRRIGTLRMVIRGQ